VQIDVARSHALLPLPKRKKHRGDALTDKKDTGSLGVLARPPECGSASKLLPSYLPRYSACPRPAPTAPPAAATSLAIQ
jgi:hypothetical protein